MKERERLQIGMRDRATLKGDLKEKMVLRVKEELTEVEEANLINTILKGKLFKAQERKLVFVTVSVYLGKVPWLVSNQQIGPYLSI